MSKFLDHEVNILRKYVKKYEAVFELAKSNIKLKSGLWCEIAKDYNSDQDINVKRSAVTLRKKWNLMNYTDIRSVEFPSSFHSGFDDPMPSTSTFQLNVPKYKTNANVEKLSDALKEEITKIEMDKKEKEKELEEIRKFKKIHEEALLALEIKLIDKNIEYKTLLMKEERGEKTICLNDGRESPLEDGTIIDVDHYPGHFLK